MPKAIDDTLKGDLIRAEVATIGHWRRWGFPHRSIQRVGSGEAIVGTAVTVACPSEDNSIVHHAVSLLREGDILVIDRLGDNDVACWGGVVNYAAKLRGAAAVIIDGPCTDIREIEQAGLPIWCRGVSGRTSLPLGNAGRINVPIAVGGAVVMPGDAILCDDDGLVVLPPSEAAAVAKRAIEHQSRAGGTLASLREGQSIAEMSGAAAKIRKAQELPL
ncbi:RraA family protein [Sphingomonas crocodyli]|uniref:Putative 4-hydroxy-4-methyl-2-oxoglutarate aldolase n=1 Tax=Sphingomonas crocodyli TaxID=1979270 RepID=A0A437M7K9_9SPHN|nr:RraA family protein [Sphingomonas crocodyli]RVT93536.1 RraA family protein [Sphingomonas crocodyli]